MSLISSELLFVV